MFKSKKKTRKSRVTLLDNKNIHPLILSVCDTLDCDSGICDVVIPACIGEDYGKRIVRVFIAKDEAADFASTTDLATEATWDTKLGYNCTGANLDNRIVSIGYVYDGVKPAEALETEPGPFGNDELVNIKDTVTFSIKKWDTTLIDSINDLRCRPTVKMWYVTDTGWVFGGVTGFENTSIVWGHIQHPGNGGGRVKSDNTMSWNQIDQSTPVYLPELIDKINP